MTRNRFNQAKQASSNISLSPSKARQLFLEDNDNIDLKDTNRITNVHPPIVKKKMLLIKSFMTITYYPLQIK